MTASANQVAQAGEANMVTDVGACARRLIIRLVTRRLKVNDSRTRRGGAEERWSGGVISLSNVRRDPADVVSCICSTSPSDQPARRTDKWISSNFKED